jgi:hypothetical protein
MFKMVKKNEVKQVVNENDTTAIDTLHPGSHPTDGYPGTWTGDLTRMGILAKMIGASNAVRDDEKVAEFFTKMVARANELGHGAGIGDEAGGNAASINTKLGAANHKDGQAVRHGMPGAKNPPAFGSGDKLDAPGACLGVTRSLAKEAVKEDLKAFLGSDESLTEEFKEKASTLFEAAVSARVAIEQAALQEEFDAAVESELASHLTEIQEGLDAFLDYAVDQWMTENKVAIESSLRNEIMSEALQGIRDVFVNANINVPEEQVDVIDVLSQKVDELETRLAEAIEENADLRGSVSESARKEVFDGVVESLTLADKEKFKTLAEDFSDVEDLETYKGKLEVIRETFKKPAAKQTISEALEEVTPSDEAEEGTKVVFTDANIKSYYDVLSRTVKK